MTDAELYALEAAARVATSGPWGIPGREDLVKSDKGAEVAFCAVVFSSEPACSVSAKQATNNAAYIAAANPAVVLELIAELRARTALLEEIYSNIGEKINGACNVCSTYTHKLWCYYPRLAQILGKPLDEFDTKFLAAKEATNG